MPSTVTSPVAIRGALARYDVDCVAVDVPAGGALFALATAPNGACTDNLALDAYDPRGNALGSDADSGPFGCPRIDGRDPALFTWARGLPAGRYTVCVRENSDRRAVPAYLLAL